MRFFKSLWCFLGIHHKDFVHDNAHSERYNHYLCTIRCKHCNRYKLFLVAGRNVLLSSWKSDFRWPVPPPPPKYYNNTKKEDND